MIKSDNWIRERCLKERMIEPFVERQDGGGKVSFGLSSYGYDIRVADELQGPQGQVPEPDGRGPCEDPV